MTSVIAVRYIDSERFLFETPSKRKNAIEELHCSLDGCTLFASGHCVCTLDDSCVYGHIRRIYGHTRRAQKYSTFRKNAEERERECAPWPRKTPKIMQIIGDYVWLPYNYLDCNEALRGLLKSSFVHVNDFNLDLVEKIVRGNAYPWFHWTNTPIADYQEKSVPMFLKHLGDVFPDLYDQYAQKYGHANIPDAVVIPLSAMLLGMKGTTIDGYDISITRNYRYIRINYDLPDWCTLVSPDIEAAFSSKHDIDVIVTKMEDVIRIIKHKIPYRIYNGDK